MPVVAWYVGRFRASTTRAAFGYDDRDRCIIAFWLGRITFPEGAPDGLDTYQTGGGYAILPLSNYRGRAPRET
jgi:hypothetical protein